MAVVGNDVNAHMKNPQWNVGVLNVPDSHPSTVLYNDRQAEHDFHEMDVDIYEARQKYSGTDNKKFPKVLLWLGGIIGAFGLYKLARFLMKK